MDTPSTTNQRNLIAAATDRASSVPVAPGQGERLLQWGNSWQLVGKENRAPLRRHFNKRLKVWEDSNRYALGAFSMRRGTVRQLFEDATVRGWAWSLGYFRQNWRKAENFIAAWLLATDHDDNLSVEEALLDPDARQYGAFAYPSPSDGKKWTAWSNTRRRKGIKRVLGARCRRLKLTFEMRFFHALDGRSYGRPCRKCRIVYQADQLIPHAGRLSALLVGLVDHFKHLQPDPVCIDVPRFFYGSTKPGAVWLGNVLPLTVAGAWTRQATEQDYALHLELKRREAMPKRTIAKDGDEAERRFQNALDKQYLRVAGTRSGRLQAVFGGTRHLAKYLPYYACATEDKIEREMWAAAQANGATAKYDKDEVQRMIDNGFTAGKKDPPMELVVYERASAPALRVVRRAQDLPATDDAQPAAQPFKPLTFHEETPYAIVCPEVAVILRHVQASGKSEFSTPEIAESVGRSPDTVAKWVKHGVVLGVWSELTAEIIPIEGIPIGMKNAGKSVANSGEAKARRGRPVKRYRLTPDLGVAAVHALLADAIQELGEAPLPDAVRPSDAVAACRDEDKAEQLALVTSEAASTVEAFEVSANVERWAVERRNTILLLAERDITPIKSDRLPESPADLARLRTEQYAAMREPGTPIRHIESMWVAGKKQKSMSGVIAKTRLIPSEYPVYQDIPLEGKDLFKAALSASRKHGGSPCAWVDASGNAIEINGRPGFSRDVPPNVAAVRLNQGKTYTVAPSIEAKQDAIAARQQGTVAPPPQTLLTPDERRQRAAQNAILPSMKGCALARGWKHVPGPFGFWEREGVTVPNTFDGVFDALLMDYEWAAAQRQKRERAESLGEVA